VTAQAAVAEGRSLPGTRALGLRPSEGWLTLLATAMTGAITLVTDFLYSSTTTTVAAALVALLFATLWYVIPLRRLAQR